MNRQKGSIINQLLKIWPAKTVAVSSWLRKQDIYRQLVSSYQKGAWLHSIGRGAFVRFNEKVDWTGALYALQEQLHLPIHAGGKTALQLKGYSHFLPMGKRPRVSLFGSSLTKLPSWFKKHDWDVEIEYTMTNLFPTKDECGLTGHNFESYSISISAPERAIMEVLYFIPKKQSFEEAKLLMEGMTTLRPKLVQELLESCTSVRVKRLFLFLAEECHHNWVKQLVKDKIDLGEGKRSIVKGGRLDPIYNITVPNVAFSDEDRLIQEFLNHRARSPATRLMVPNNARKILFEPAQGAFASIAFLAYHRGQLHHLDELIRRFKIEKQGTMKFKGDLEENWLDFIKNDDTDRTGKISKITIAALAELVVAEHLQREGWIIEHLSAWNDQNPDITCKRGNNTLDIEVKYLGEIPQFLRMGVARLRGEEPAREDQYLDDEAAFNHFFGTIAKAVQQLENNYFKTRLVWLVFSKDDQILRKRFEQYELEGPCAWHDDTELQRQVLDMHKETIGTGGNRHPPSIWLAKIPTIVLSTMKDWYLEDIKEYNLKDITQ